MVLLAVAVVVGVAVALAVGVAIGVAVGVVVSVVVVVLMMMKVMMMMMMKGQPVSQREVERGRAKSKPISQHIGRSVLTLLRDMPTKLKKAGLSQSQGLREADLENIGRFRPKPADLKG